ncbi:MAG: amidohydrolase family protein [Parvibaculaceae bacterium]
MGSVVISNCRIARGDPAAVDEAPADVLIEGTRIAAILPPRTAKASSTIDGSRCLLTAGMINGHFHSHEHFQKGRFEKLPLEMWMNFVRPPAPVKLNARQVYLRTLIGAIEAIRSGTTTIVDDVNIGADLDREHLAAVHRAYEDIGIRALVGISMMDRPFFAAVPFVEEEFDPALLVELRNVPVARAQDLIALAEELAQTRHPAKNRVGFIVSPSAPQRCSDEFLLALRAIADRHGLPVMIHAQETRLQVVGGLLDRGITHIERLSQIGFLKPATTIIHGVWLNPGEILLLAESGATVQHNPWSNLCLGSGVAPVRALLAAGVNVSLATDGCSSTGTCNLLTTLGLASVLHTLRGDDESWIGAAEAFRAATIGGAVALGRGGELGIVREGAIADLVLYRLDSIPFIPEGNLIQQLARAERGASVAAVLVDGESVFSDGRFRGIDEAEILREVAAEFTRLRPLYDQAETSAARMLPALKRIHARCALHSIPESTYQARFN